MTLFTLLYYYLHQGGYVTFFIINLLKYEPLQTYPDMTMVSVVELHVIEGCRSARSMCMSRIKMFSDSGWKKQTLK